MSIIKLNNRGVKDVTAFGSISSLGTLSLIQKQTASNSSTISFTSGIDSSFKEYIFFFNNLNASTNNYITVNFRDGSTDYDATKTTTAIYSSHKDDDGLDSLAILAGNSLGQSTGTQRLTDNEMGQASDDGLSGIMHLYDPSNATFIKHFHSVTQFKSDVGSHNCYVAGYCNVTAAIDGVQFGTSSGTIESGDILLFGVN